MVNDTDYLWQLSSPRVDVTNLLATLIYAVRNRQLFQNPKFPNPANWPIVVTYLYTVAVTYLPRPVLSTWDEPSY